MRAYPNRGLLAASLVVGLALVACGQSASSGVPGGTGQAATPAGGSPTEAPPDGQTAEPTQAPQPTAAGGGTGNVPALTNGEWTGGTAHAEVTGDVTGSFDAPIMVGLAMTDGSVTQLTYVDPNTASQIAVAINGSDVAVSVGTAGWIGGGGTSGSQCTPQFTKGDATNLAGTVTCTHAPVIDATGVQNKFIDIVVTFEATR